MKLHKNIKLLAWFNFFLDFRLYAPIAIIYFTKVSGSFALGMAIFSIATISTSIFEIPTGIYSDIIGKRKTLILGALTSVISVVFYAIGGSFIFLAIGAIIEGIARAFYSGNNEAFLLESLQENGQSQEYANYLGKTSAMFQWALAISAVLGGVIATFSFPLVMWLSVIPATLGLMVSLKMIEPKVNNEVNTNVYSHLKTALGLFKSNHNLRNLSILKIISFAVGESGYQFSSAFIATLWPIWAIGFSKMLSNIGAAISFHFSGKIIKKYRSFPILVFGKIYSFISNVIALIYPTIFSPALMATTSIFYGTGSVAMSNLLQNEYSQKQRSTMGSINSLFGSIAFAIVSFSLGLFADQIGPNKALLSLQIISIFTLFLIWKLFSKNNNTKLS